MQHLIIILGSFIFLCLQMGGMGGLCVKALASHHCGPGSIPEQFRSQAVLRGHIWVDVAGCRRRLYVPATRQRCSRILRNSASQLPVRMISLPNYYYYYL